MQGPGCRRGAYRHAVAKRQRVKAALAMRAMTTGLLLQPRPCQGSEALQQLVGMLPVQPKSAGLRSCLAKCGRHFQPTNQPAVCKPLLHPVVASDATRIMNARTTAAARSSEPVGRAKERVANSFPVLKSVSFHQALLLLAACAAACAAACRYLLSQRQAGRREVHR